MYAVLKSLQDFRNLIGQTKVQIHSDNRNITFTPAKITSRAQRWKLLLSDFNFELNHIAGEDNKGADFLSRCLYIQNESINDLLAELHNEQANINDEVATTIMDKHLGPWKIDGAGKVIVPDHFLDGRLVVYFYCYLLLSKLSPCLSTTSIKL